MNEKTFFGIYLLIYLLRFKSKLSKNFNFCLCLKRNGSLPLESCQSFKSDKFL